MRKMKMTKDEKKGKYLKHLFNLKKSLRLSDEYLCVSHSVTLIFELKITTDLLDGISITSIKMRPGGGAQALVSDGKINEDH